jgi:hypothetical protein
MRHTGLMLTRDLYSAIHHVDTIFLTALGGITYITMATAPRVRKLKENDADDEDDETSDASSVASFSFILAGQCTSTMHLSLTCEMSQSLYYRYITIFPVKKFHEHRDVHEQKSPGSVFMNTKSGQEFPLGKSSTYGLFVFMNK